MKESQVTIEFILSMLRGRRVAFVREALDDMNPVDIADLFHLMLEEHDLSREELGALFRILPKETAADTFVAMDTDMQQTLIASFSDAELSDIINDLYADDTADIIEEMPANVVKRILRSIAPDMREGINQLLQYPQHSAGSMMTFEFVYLRKTMTVAQAFDRIRATGVDKETIYTCYITSTGGLLEGLITVKDMLLASAEARLEHIMTTNIISCHTLDDQEEVAHMFTRYAFSALPVVDNENRLVGIITIDDALEVLQDEASEDIAKMAAMTPTDKPYSRTGVMELWKNRIPWLFVLMVSATFTGMIISSFEDMLASFVVLTVFIPMLTSTGGNAGSQSSATMIRGLSLGDIEFSRLFFVMWKEFRVSILCGVTLAAANFLRLILLDRMALDIALIVSITLVLTVIFAKLIGCALPMLAKRFGFDPAVMAGPFITTIVDVVTLSFYLRIAQMVLRL